MGLDRNGAMCKTQWGGMGIRIRNDLINGMALFLQFKHLKQYYFHEMLRRRKSKVESKYKIIK